MLDAPADDAPALAALPSRRLTASAARRAFYRTRQTAWHLVAAGLSGRKLAPR
ncbi:hypothetical protein [Streptomyces sp. NPDC086023]|uniref:hypothetical protein n=1 Tax=Streptomyces sp. NPDC086023 TaxID=3365746 RepID=UPI0037D5A1FB